MINDANKKHGLQMGIVAIQSISSNKELANQDNNYTVVLSGVKNGQQVTEYTCVDAIQRIVYPNENFDSFLQEGINPDLKIIVSNSTEAGIVVNKQDTLNNASTTFPGKLTQLLYHRYIHGINQPLAILPCELVEDNGKKLYACVEQYSRHWDLGPSFNRWNKDNVVFCDTLVDRIVPGFPKDRKEKIWEEIGYKDKCMVEAEFYHLWAIEAPRWVQEELPLHKKGINVIYTDNLGFFRNRKLRILNGAHTCMASIGLLSGFNTVNECMDNTLMSSYLRYVVYNEIIPTIGGDREEMNSFAAEVFIRFQNPFIAHKLSAIVVNNFEKFKIRILPVVQKHYHLKGALPKGLVFSLASHIYFFKSCFEGAKAVEDMVPTIDAMKGLWGKFDKPGDTNHLIEALLQDQRLWGNSPLDLTGLSQALSACLNEIETIGMAKSLGHLMEGENIV